MIAQVIIENGQKKIIPLTTDAGAGNPVGTIIVVCSNQIPSNYLPLGTQFDTTLYPVLYALLGTDTTPTASALGLPTLTSGQYAIKATSGLSENAQDNVINTLNEQRSYSTEEVNTGKKWLDGKDIYRKTFVFTNLTLSNSPTLIGTIDVAIDKVTKTEEIVRYPDVLAGSSQQAVYTEQNGNVYAYQNVSSIQTGWEVYYTIEYTKTV